VAGWVWQGWLLLALDALFGKWAVEGFFFSPADFLLREEGIQFRKSFAVVLERIRETGFAKKTMAGRRVLSAPGRGKAPESGDRILRIQRCFLAKGAFAVWWRRMGRKCRFNKGRGGNCKARESLTLTRQQVWGGNDGGGMIFYRENWSRNGFGKPIFSTK